MEERKFLEFVEAIGDIERDLGAMNNSISRNNEEEITFSMIARTVEMKVGGARYFLVTCERAKKISKMIQEETKELELEKNKLLGHARAIIENTAEGFQLGKSHASKIGHPPKIANLAEFLRILDIDKLKIYLIENKFRVNIFPDSKKETLIKNACNFMKVEYSPPSAV